MKVQKIRFSDQRVSWTVLDEQLRPIAPLEQFLRFLENAGRSPLTVRAYAHHLLLWWQFLRQYSRDWQLATLAWLADFIHWLRRPDPSVIPIRPDSIEPARKPSTINAIVSAVVAFYDFHERLDTINGPRLKAHSTRFGNPAHYQSFLTGIATPTTKKSKVKQPVPKMEPATLTAEQVQTLIKACQLKRDQFLLSLLYQTGMRIGQALGLHHHDIESWNNRIQIRPRDNNLNQARAKTLKPYVVHVSEGLMVLYTDYLVEEYPQEIDSDYVFVVLSGPRLGQALSYGAVTSLFQRLGKKTGIVTHAHVFRHTHITELMQQNVNPKVIQERVGHQSIQTTLNTYTHLSEQDFKQEIHQYHQTHQNQK